MDESKEVNIFEIKKIHIVHDYLDRGWQVHLQKPKQSSGGITCSAKNNMNRLVLRNMEENKDLTSRDKRIVLSLEDMRMGSVIKDIDDEIWMKDNKKTVCVYSFLHNTLRKGWKIHKKKDLTNSNISSGTYCFSKPHKNQVKYLSQKYLQNFIVDNVNDNLEKCFE